MAQSVERTWRDKYHRLNLGLFTKPGLRVRINFRQAYKTESIDNAVFGIPETAEKLGFYKLQLCENLFLRVFHWEQI